MSNMFILNSRIAIVINPESKWFQVLLLLGSISCFFSAAIISTFDGTFDKIATGINFIAGIILLLALVGIKRDSNKTKGQEIAPAS